MSCEVPTTCSARHPWSATDGRCRVDVARGLVKSGDPHVPPSIWQDHGDVAGHLSYPIFMPKPSTHRMHDPGSNVPHIRPKGFTENQMS
jgi:hypothetical protein